MVTVAQKAYHSLITPSFCSMVAKRSMKLSSQDIQVHGQPLLLHALKSLICHLLASISIESNLRSLWSTIADVLEELRTMPHSMPTVSSTIVSLVWASSSCTLPGSGGACLPSYYLWKNFSSRGIFSYFSVGLTVIWKKRYEIWETNGGD